MSHRLSTMVVLLGTLLAGQGVAQPLMQAHKFPESRIVVFAQSVGFPKK